MTVPVLTPAPAVKFLNVSSFPSPPSKVTLSAPLIFINGVASVVVPESVRIVPSERIVNDPANWLSETAPVSDISLMIVATISPVIVPLLIASNNPPAIVREVYGWPLPTETLVVNGAIIGAACPMAISKRKITDVIDSFEGSEVIPENNLYLSIVYSI
jgi:hypothetical protein